MTKKITIEQVNDIKNQRINGVVFTPDHIAQLMRELINISDKDVVLDICAGEGKLTETLTDEQLILIEYEDYMSDVLSVKYPNATVINDSCFDVDLSKYKITKSLMNPPYNSKKQAIKWKELEFAKYALDNMELNGELALLVPTSVFLDKNKKLRSNLLKDHTLKAVITMPGDIFYIDGKKSASVNTAIGIFKAKIPHDTNKPVYIYDYDDGLVIHKHKGRVETDKSHSNKEALINNYKKLKVVKNISNTVNINHEDEILYDCFLETEKPTELDFKNKLKDYLTFEFKNNIQDVIND